MEIDKRTAFRNGSNQLSLEEKQQGDALGREIEFERERTNGPELGKEDR